MKRGISRAAVAMGLIALIPGTTHAAARALADLQAARLSFDQSVLNQMTYGTYREPFDELHEYDLEAMTEGTVTCGSCHRTAHEG